MLLTAEEAVGDSAIDLSTSLGVNYVHSQAAARFVVDTDSIHRFLLAVAVRAAS